MNCTYLHTSVEYPKKNMVNCQIAGHIANATNQRKKCYNIRYYWR